MDTTAAFSTKACKYARFRWDYAPQAIQTLIDGAQLSRTSIVADVGAGTGILSRHLAGCVARLYAVEPNPNMCRIAQIELRPFPSATVVDGRAEATTLPDHSVDLIAVAQAIHWFDPEPTKREFTRILKPGGWLALLRNYGTDEALGQAIRALRVPENGIATRRATQRPEGKPASYYPRSPKFQKWTYPFVLHESWEGFIGALLSASDMPDEDHPRYAHLERAARRVFDRFSTGGLLEVCGETELCLGHVIRSGGLRR
jgi:ubiquinone/menaquinone biosynthesis C-methylase UbiE